MSYQVEFKAEAIAGLEVLTSTIQERLFRKIRWLCETFNDLTPLRQAPNFDSRVTTTTS
jgi:mRNA interferase RelE/StbE